MYPETTALKLTRPSGSGNPAQSSTGHSYSGFALRRAELAALNIGDIQIRQRHWAIVDLIGKGGHVRTVPMPTWVKDSVDQWLAATDLKHGRIFRAVSRHGSCWVEESPRMLSGTLCANAQSVRA